MSPRIPRPLHSWDPGAIALALTLCCAACPEPTTTTNDPPGPFDRYLEARCASLERCADSHGRAYPNLRVCQDQLRARVDCGITARDPLRHVEVELERRWRGGDGLVDCLDWLARAPCDAVHTVEAPVCRQLLEVVDGLSAGARCENWEQICQVGLRCAHPDDPQLCAVCEPAVAEGQACDPQRPACDEGLFCAASSSSCVPLGGAGASCSDDAHCRSGRCSDARCTAPGLRESTCSDNDGCAWELRCINGRCGDGLDEGDSCAHSGECLGGLFCVEGICRAYSLCADLDRDQPCPFPFDTCDWDGYCSPITGHCEAVPYAYSECSYVNWQCLGDLYCDFEQSPAECADRKELGEPCGADRQCDSGYCHPSSELCSAAPACTLP